MQSVTLRRTALALALLGVVFAIAFMLGRRGDSETPARGGAAVAGATPRTTTEPTPVAVSGLEQVRSSIPALKTPKPTATSTPKPSVTSTATATAPPVDTATAPPATVTATVTFIDG